MVVAHQIRDGIAPVVDLVFPPRCPLCGEAMAAQDGLCASCWSELVIPGEPCCSLCQRPLAGDGLTGDAICAPCLADPPKHDGIAAATLYNDASRRLILAFKHGRRIALASLIGHLVATRVPLCDERLLVVPVPLHRWRLWRRGFNQSALIARELAKRVGGELAVDALERRKHTPALGGLGNSARKQALSGAIAVASHGRSLIDGRTVLLVDDVLTSGATSAACVSVLKRAGARRVLIACFARVLSEAIATSGSKNETPGAEAPGVARR